MARSSSIVHLHPSEEKTPLQLALEQCSPLPEAPPWIRLHSQALSRHQVILSAPCCAAETTLTIQSQTAPPVCIPGHILMNMRTTEIMRLLDVSPSGTSVVVVRGYNNTPAYPMQAGDVLLFLGIAPQDVPAQNYTQIFCADQDLLALIREEDT